MKKNKILNYLKQHIILISFIQLVLLILATFWGWRYYMEMIRKNGLDEAASTRTFAHHYVMISDDTNSALWQEIYKSACEEGEGSDAWIEMFGDWMTDEYTAEDYMEIAIAAKVDGIIVKPDGTDAMRKAINHAEREGIPVITVLEDDSQSSRHSFVGVNTYQLGTAFGGQIKKCISNDTRSVLVLLNEKDAGKDLVYKQIKATLQEDGTADSVNIDCMTIRSQNEFDTEEVIRDIFIEASTRPDVLVCTNETDSERAYQAMIDYNCVGDVEIVGYYQSQTILQAIQKGTVPMAIALDTEKIGICCIEALEELKTMGHVSNYFSIDLSIVTRSNVADFLPQEEV